MKNSDKAVKKPLYILAAVPTTPERINKIFEGGEGSVMHLLKNPGTLRYAGWDLQTLDTPRIIKGKYLEVNNGDRKVIHLYEDGTLIFRCAADDEYLGWPRDEKDFYEHPRLNPMAVIESTYCFVDFYRKLIPHFIQKPMEINFKLELKNTFLENSKIYMIPFALNTYGWRFDDERYPAPENNMKESIMVSSDDLLEYQSHVGFKLIRKIFVWFGIEETKIPYIKTDEKGQKVVDIDKIIHSKG